MFCADLFLCSHLSDCIPGLHFTGLFVSVLHFEPFVVALLRFYPSCLKAVLQIARSWSCTLTVFSCDERLYPFPSLADALVCLNFLLEEHLWPEPSWVPILTFSHPSIVEKCHFLGASPLNHCAQEISRWSAFPSFCFKLFQRTYESASHLVMYHHLHTRLQPFVFSLLFPSSIGWLHVSAGFHPETVNLGNTNWHRNVLPNPALLHTVPMRCSDFSHFSSQQLCHLPGWPTINVTYVRYSAFVRDSLVNSVRSINQGYITQAGKTEKAWRAPRCLHFRSTASTSVKRHFGLYHHCWQEQQCCIPAVGAHRAPDALLWHYFRLTQGDRCLLLNHQHKCLKYLRFPSET